MRLTGSRIYVSRVVMFRYVFQEETSNTGTPHLQGVINLRTQVAFATVKQWNLRAHWESTRDVHASVRYCSDATKRTGRIWTSGFSISAPDLQLLEPDAYRPWQQDLSAELEQHPDARSIFWYYDPHGGSGKTAFVRSYCSRNDDALFFTGGNARDLGYQIVKLKRAPRVIFFNYSRSQEGKISYASIESIKDGLISSAKYEGGFKIFAHPHVVTMANWLPDLGALSHDRWKIYAITGNNFVAERMFE